MEECMNDEQMKTIRKAVHDKSQEFRKVIV